MAERVIEVGVHPEVRKEMESYYHICDPVARKMHNTESDSVFSYLYKTGHFEPGMAVLIYFLPDESVDLNDSQRPVRIFKAIRDSEGFIHKFGKPIETLEIETLIDGRN